MAVATAQELQRAMAKLVPFYVVAVLLIFPLLLALKKLQGVSVKAKAAWRLCLSLRHSHSEQGPGIVVEIPLPVSCGEVRNAADCICYFLITL